jgi:hypothetical protein
MDSIEIREMASYALANRALVEHFFSPRVRPGTSCIVIVVKQRLEPGIVHDLLSLDR